MPHRRRPPSRTRMSQLLWVSFLSLAMGLPTAIALSSLAEARTVGSLSLGPPLYAGKLTATKKGSKCRRGCAATCKTLTLTPSQYQLHCKAKGYSGLVIFSGKRCKKAGKKIHCWFKNKHLTFRGSRSK